MAVIDTRGGAFANLPQTLLQMLVNERQTQAAKEDLKLRQADFKLRQEQYQNEQALAERDRQTSIRVAQGLLPIIAMAQPGMANQLRQISPDALPGAVPGALDVMQSLAQTRATTAGAVSTEQTTDIQREVRPSTVAQAAAGARVATSQANVAEATEGAARDQVFANLADTNFRNQLQAQILRGSDPVNGARAVEAWIASEGQLTFREATQAVGFTGETTINPELRFQSSEAGGNADASRARGFLPSMMESNETIRALNQSGVRLSLPSAIQKSTRSGAIDAFLNSISDPRQQQLVQASRSFADMYRFSLSGQQSGEGERLAMLMSITDQFRDDDAVLAQKQRLRDVMVTVMQQRAGGTMGALEAAEIGLRVASQLGDDAVTAAFQERVDAVRADIARGVTISAIPGDNTYGDTSTIIDSVLRGN